MTTAPEGYVRLPDGIKCRCVHMWQLEDGSHWCCQQGKGERTHYVETPRQLTAFNIRVARFYKKWMANMILGRGDPIADLADFVRSEVGRTDERLDNSEALVLYFKDDKDRGDFLASIRAELATRGRELDAMQAKELP